MVSLSMTTLTLLLSSSSIPLLFAGASQLAGRAYETGSPSNCSAVEALRGGLTGGLAIGVLTGWLTGCLWGKLLPQGYGPGTS